MERVRLTLDLWSGTCRTWSVEILDSEYSWETIMVNPMCHMTPEAALNEARAWVEVNVEPFRQERLFGSSPAD